MTNQSR